MSNIDTAAMRERAQAAKALADAARPGPWITQKYPGEIDFVRQETWTPCGIAGHDDCAVAQTSRSHGTPEVALCLIDHSYEHLALDAAFIAASRTIVPELAEYILQLIEYIRSKELLERLGQEKSALAADVLALVTAYEQAASADQRTGIRLGGGQMATK